MTTKKPKLACNEEGNKEYTVKKANAVQPFDPRHTADRPFCLDTSLKQLDELKNVFPNTGVVTHICNYKKFKKKIVN